VKRILILILILSVRVYGAAPTLETNAAADTLRIMDGTSGDPVTWNDVWEWGAGGGAGLVPKDGGGDARVDTFMTEVVADAVYLVLKDVDFGNAVDSTYFLIQAGECVYMTTFKPQVKASATLMIGEANNTDYNKKPAYFRFGAGGATRQFSQTNSTVGAYGACLIVDSVAFAGVVQWGTTTTFKRVIIGGDAFTGWSITFGTIDWYDVSFYTIKPIMSFGPTITAEDIVVEGGTEGISLAGGNATFTGLFVDNIANDEVLVTTAHTLTLKDPKVNITNGEVAIANADGVVIEQYTCNIHIADEDGANLEGLSIACTTFGNVVSNDAGANFYKCIVDHQSGVDGGFAQEVAADKWEVTTAAYAALAGCTGGAGAGAWVTGIDYKKSATEFTGITTDVNGDIAEQTIDYKKWVGTSEALLTHSPHTFTLTYGGDTHVVTDFTVDALVVWHLEFPPMATMLTAIYDKLPTNYMMGSSDGADDDGTLNTISTAVVTTIPGTITTAQNDLNTITGGSGVLIDTDAIDADAIKADAVTEIQSGLATEAKQDIIDTNVDQIETAVITNAAGTDIAADIIALDTVADTIAIDVAGLDGEAMRGTDSANTVVPDAAGTAAVLHAATDALIAALNNLSIAQAQAAAAAALTAYDPATRTEATADKDEVIAAVGDIEVDNDAIADAVLDELVEGAVSLRQAMRLFLSVFTGKTTGGGTTQIRYYNLDGTKVRLDVNVDSRGNRTKINTRDGS